MLAHGFPITHLPQKLEKHYQPTKWGHRSLSLAQFHFFSAPKSGNFPVHCFVLLGVSFIQLKLNQVRAKQCYSISEFRLSTNSTDILTQENRKGSRGLVTAGFSGNQLRARVSLRASDISPSTAGRAVNPLRHSRTRR